MNIGNGSHHEASSLHNKQSLVLVVIVIVYQADVRYKSMKYVTIGHLSTFVVDLHNSHLI